MAYQPSALSSQSFKFNYDSTVAPIHQKSKLRSMASIIQSTYNPCWRHHSACPTPASKLTLHATFGGRHGPFISISSASGRRCGLVTVKAAVSAVDAPGTSGLARGTGGCGPEKVVLEVRGLKAVISETRQEILKGVNLIIREGEVHAIMGKNGSGKSTFAKVLVGHPDYEVTEGSVIFKGENLLEMEPENRSLAGLFMSFQSPIEIPGVSNDHFLRMAYNARRRALNLPELEPLEFFTYVSKKLELVNMEPEFLNRNVNEGFSGGEKKRNEILQLAVLGADLAILDEIDSGLDVDALKTVAQAVNKLLTPTNSVLMITHYRRLLEFIKPEYIHVMEDGRIIKTGDITIADILEKGGYQALASP